MGDPISDRNGVRCCPAMEQGSDEKYIVKIISNPASQNKLEAMILSGAYPDVASAAAYFKTLAEGVIEEATILNKLSQLEGFLSYDKWQLVPMESEAGYDVYILSKYRRTLEQKFRHEPMTHLEALNLGLDLCAALAVCRRSGYLYIDLKPENIYLNNEGAYRIGDIGFVKLNSLKYASLPDRYKSAYSAPELVDAFSSLNTSIDIYALGLILYQVFNGGQLPEIDPENVTTPVAPDYADYEMAEIILKACAADPAERWQDPVDMGHALVSYMQRNGAHDTPIIPTTTPEPEVPEEFELNEEEVADQTLTEELNEGTDSTEEATTSDNTEEVVVVCNSEPVFDEELPV
ncbi:MAG: protein kinase, partial [Bacteroidales bacterium]|nr:protein kinase [Bacteroidales bacterium]